MQIYKIKFFKKLEHWENPHIWWVSFSESKDFQMESFFTMLSFGFFFFLFVLFFLSFPNHKAASRQLQLHVSFSCVYPPTNSETGFRRVQCLLPPVSTSTVATNTWVGSPHLYVPACSFRSRKTTKYIAIITKEQQQNFFFWRWCLYSFSHFFHKSHLLEESVVFPDITIQLF